MRRFAIYSPCKRYRYVLRRVWDGGLPTVLFVALNPSTADHVTDDATVRRCIGFARDWGFGGLVIANLFALRSTDPSALARAADPIGPENDRWLALLSRRVRMTVAAWGVAGSLRRRAEEVLPKLVNVHHLGLTRDGQPRHPLYLPRSLRLIRMLSVFETDPKAPAPQQSVPSNNPPPCFDGLHWPGRRDRRRSSPGGERTWRVSPRRRR